MRGVVNKIPLDEDLEKLKKSVSGGQVNSIQRLKRTVNGYKQDSQSVLIEF